MKAQTKLVVPTTVNLKRVAAYAVMILAIMISAFMVVLQVFTYRHDYREYNAYIREREDLKAEKGRLLIEKQTFGATAQIGTRAVTQLRMYSPPARETVVVSLPAKSEHNK
ncbi:cell division protein FtsL [Acinetobacter larvae]|uniref:Cell division protein FtsL n=1 Tax=Acinetobacter larvae TaxID=1789224 RepID=A0A1B2M2T0_9GAMM|nr:cell division protein FtsL [Acinetobacter larvae]AOA59451.1 cell division protein FtsL [Acinetobacter larvae]